MSILLPEDQQPTCITFTIKVDKKTLDTQINASGGDSDRPAEVFQRAVATLIATAVQFCGKEILPRLLTAPPITEVVEEEEEDGST